MIKSLISFSAVLTLLASMASAQEITLRSSVIVEDKYITLGDLFGLPGEKGARRVAYSPTPGKRSTFDAKWLYRVARTHKISWRPLTLKTKVTVERASQQIFHDDLKTVILDRLKEKGLGADIEISMSGRVRTIHLPTDVEPAIEIDNLVFDPKSARFVATVAAPAGDLTARRHRIAGRVHKMVSIPVVSKRLRSGDIIKKHHVEWVRVRKSSVRRDTVLHEEDLVGMAVKRVLRERAPIKLSYVQRPLLVKKNGLVTIQLSSRLMTLTAQGKALQDGSKGEVVQVRNIQSKKLIEAIVTSTGKVSVNSAPRLAMNDPGSAKR